MSEHLTTDDVRRTARRVRDAARAARAGLQDDHSEADHVARVALWVRLGRPGRAPWPRYAATRALIDYWRHGTAGTLRRAAYAELGVRARLGVAITEVEVEPAGDTPT